LTASSELQKCAVSLLTGGSDKPYVFGLSTELISKGVAVDLIGSDELDCREFHDIPRLKFLNLRGDQRHSADLVAKVLRVLAYYCRLIRYAATSKPGIFHILWNNKFETFDRTILMFYYRLLGKTVVLTAHNVNASKRDCKDTLLNRFTLQVQYQLADHIFVHTAKMKNELMDEFGIPAGRITVIPFGINNSVPDTGLSSREAKKRLGLRENQKTILFFGRIKPYKGIQYLISAFLQLGLEQGDYKLIIAGKLEEGCEKYWESIQRDIRECLEAGRIISRIEFIPDSESEVFFKAADVLVLPYREIFQSGVIFLGYNFGLPVLAADVGSLKDEIVDGKTGFVFRSADPTDLARTIEKYFASELFANLEQRRPEIKEFAIQRHSWDAVGKATLHVYNEVLRT
jgi:D-inositol-3-phosphate glycosyltransferase